MGTKKRSALKAEEKPAPEAGAIPKATARSLAAARRVRVEDLVLLCFSQTEIAAKLGASIAVISHDVKLIREKWTQEAIETRSRYVEQRMKAYDRDERQIRGWILKTDSLLLKAKLFDRILKIEERRAKLLGADAPVKIQTQGQTELTVSAKTSESVLAEAATLLADPKATEALMVLQDSLAAQAEADRAKPAEAKVVDGTGPADNYALARVLVERGAGEGSIADQVLKQAIPPQSEVVGEVVRKSPPRDDDLEVEV